MDSQAGGQDPDLRGLVLYPTPWQSIAFLPASVAREIFICSPIRASACNWTLWNLGCWSCGYFSRATGQARHSTSSGYPQEISAEHNADLFSCRYIEIKTEDDLFAPGAKPGTIPTDIDQATGLERLELIGKMQGIDIFDMRPLDASRKGMTP